MPNLTWSESRDGALIVADPSESPMGSMLGIGKGSKNHHCLDYPLFHMNIRQNAGSTVKLGLSAKDGPTDSD